MGPWYTKKVLEGMFIPQSYTSSIPEWVQGDCRGECLRTKDTDTKMEARMSSFYPAFITLWIFAGPSEESVFFSKSSF
jgi:hypothetical protein